MGRFIAAVLLMTGLTTGLCGGCVAGCARSHFGTGGMPLEPGADPLDDPEYVRLLQTEKQGKALKVGGLVVAIASGIYLLAARRLVKPSAPNPDGPAESN